MTIPLQCECGREIKAPDNRAGQSVRCMYCGRVLPVPAAGSVPAPAAETIPVRCACGKTLKAPARLAGKTARCPGCGAFLTVPDPSAAPPAIEEPDPERMPLRTSRPDRLPALAITLAILGLMDAAVVGVAGVKVWLAMSRFAAEAEKVQGELAAGDEGDPAAAAVRRLKEEGKNITLNQEFTDAQGQRFRRIEYTSATGAKGVETVFVGSGSPKKADPAARRALDRAKWVATVAAVLGLILAALAAGTLVCSIGFFLRRNWGRAGLVGLAAVQGAMVVVAVLAGGSSRYLLFSLLANGMVFFYFLSPSVRAACEE